MNLNNLFTARHVYTIATIPYWRERGYKMKEKIIQYIGDILTNLTGQAHCPFCESTEFISNLEILAQVDVHANPAYHTQQLIAITKCNLIACKNCREIILGNGEFKIKKVKEE